MITDLGVWQEKDEVIHARGPKYHFEKVLAASLGFLRSVIDDVSRSTQIAPFIDLGSGVVPFTPHTYDVIEEFYRELAATYDVCYRPISVVVGSYRVALYLLGHGGLYLSGGTEPRTVTGLPWQELDTQPGIDLLPVRKSEIYLDETLQRDGEALVRKHALPGMVLKDDPSVLSLLFAHAHFGAGREERLRIECRK